MSKLLDELEKKITAIEMLDHMMRYCDYRIVSCNCGGVYNIGYNHAKRYFYIEETTEKRVETVESGFADLEYAIKKFAELTEH